MIDQFYNMQSIIHGILKLFVILVISSILTGKKIIKKAHIEGFGQILLWASLPSLIISRITKDFDPASFAFWWVLPLCAVVMFFLAFMLSGIFCGRFRDFSSKKEFRVAASLQNSGYLPMALVAFICSGPLCDKLLIFVFLYLIGFNLVMWSFIPSFLNGKTKENFNLASIINPPLMGTIFSLVFVFIFGKGRMPAILADPLDILGNTTFPIAILMLGAYMTETKAFKVVNVKALSSLVLFKLIVFPVIIYAVLRLTGFNESYKFFLFLEATMPSAVTLVVIGHYSGADNKFLSAAIFYSHLFAMATVPLLLWGLRF